MAVLGHGDRAGFAQPQFSSTPGRGGEKQRLQRIAGSATPSRILEGTVAVLALIVVRIVIDWTPKLLPSDQMAWVHIWL